MNNNEIQATRILGRVLAEDMTLEELELVSGGLAPTDTKATDTSMQCDW